MFSLTEITLLAKRLLIFAVIVMVAWAAVFTFNFWRTASRPGRASPSAVGHFGQKAPPGVPFFTENDKYEITHISGIEFRVYTTPDGKKHFIGPPGAELLRNLDGTPISASVDQDKADEFEAMRKKSIEDMHKLIEERRRSGKL
jgi:hypothetical protein